MTFHCKNYDIKQNKCKRLSGECVPARKGCVLEGRMLVSEELEEKIRKINAETARHGKSTSKS
ncbi:MAG: hypothetical protein D3924_02115 [Candidatus Electrothrix sp. AR4]|nr:hypothetical protein [Candidatus Electrothrix sp. AR4]